MTNRRGGRQAMRGLILPFCLALAPAASRAADPETRSRLSPGGSKLDKSDQLKSGQLHWMNWRPNRWFKKVSACLPAWLRL